MEVKLKKESVTYYSKVLSVEFSQEETSDIIVPDTLPDVVSVVDSDGTAILRGKEINDGRVTVNGMIAGYVIYSADDGGGVKRLPVQLPFSTHWDSGTVTQSCKCDVKLSVSSFDTRIINSRKLLIRAEITIQMNVYCEETAEFACKTEETTELELRTESIEFSHISVVAEKTFSVTEELQLPSSKPHIGGIIKYRIQLFCDEIKPVGAKLVIKGHAAVYVVYTSATGGEVNSADFSVPFSQIFDTDIDDEIIGASARLMPTGVYLEPVENASATPNSFSLEIGVVAQICAWSSVKIEYIADAYSTQHEITIKSSDAKLQQSQLGMPTDETLIQTINTPTNIKNIIDVYSSLGKERTEENITTWNASVKVVYETDDGKFMSGSGNLELKFDGNEYMNAAVMAETGDITAKPVSGGAELRVPVMYNLITFSDINFSIPEEIEIDDEAVKDNTSIPSIVVIRADGKKSLWTYAKQFNTTSQSISEANPEMEGDVPAKGELLLVVKKR